ncbi:MAG TPA: hypothetical protein VE989_02660 [Sphingomicrobium sp.]|nr:hypothetical protein [Sphingomicrobium sp.]
MRRRTVYALGALGLATVGSAAMSQFSVPTMKIMPMDQLLRIRIPQPPPPPPPPPQAPQIQFRGCVYYEHVDWQGKWRSIPGGTRRLSLGPTWDNQISSFACSPTCRVLAFDQDFKGDRVEFATVQSVGGAWNDKISSMIATCQHPF